MGVAEGAGSGSSVALSPSSSALSFDRKADAVVVLVEATDHRSRQQLTSSVPLDPRAEYHRVFLRPSPLTGSLKAFSTGGQRSSRTVSLAGANGLLELPAMEKGGKSRLEEGETVSCVVVGELGSLAA